MPVTPASKRKLMQGGGKFKASGVTNGALKNNKCNMKNKLLLGKEGVDHI